MGPEDLHALLARLRPGKSDPRVLAGVEAGDDAGVFLFDAGRALVQTVDFFTPIVDDPRAYGEIAAANALSDVYAMGATPLLALSLVAFPADRDREELVAILAGMSAKLEEAGAFLLGGHTVDDAEPKVGLAVTGTASPEEIWTKSGAEVGDVLYLTKPVGTGIIARAIKDGVAPQDAVEAAIASMTRLNRGAADAARAAGGIHACTDVTGFGLLGHALDLARRSGVTVRLDAERVPVLPGTRELAARGHVPGGSRSNLAYVRPHTLVATGVADLDILVFADAVTSGGLLLAVAPDRASAVEAAFSERGEPVWRIGEVVARSEGRLEVVRGPEG